MTSALAGMRVLDLTRYIPGPYCTQVLGDLGADVVKVEEPGLGDPTRAVPPVLGEDSALHASLNRNKRSVVVDLRTKDGAALVRRLALASDVVVEGFRPGTLERHGLGAESLLAENPRLVYCSISGYGAVGPLAARAGHDINYNARAGWLSANRGPEGDPVLPGSQVADMSGAFAAVMGILAALVARERTGRGQVVQASLYGGALAVMTGPLARFAASGGRFPDELSGAYACYRTYRCRDGRHVSVGALEAKFWDALCTTLGLDAFRGRQWQRGTKGSQVMRAFEDVFATRDRDEWAAVFADVEACVEPVLEPGEVLRDAQAAAHLVDLGGVSGIGTPFHLSKTPLVSQRLAPALGQHTDEVLRAHGVGTAELGRLRDEGVVA